jgi:hypothetical protein
MLLLWNTANAATFLPPRKRSKGKRQYGPKDFRATATALPRREGTGRGVIVLKTPLQRSVFVAGLVGAVLLVLILSLFR